MNKKLPKEFRKLEMVTEPFRKRLYFVGILTKYLQDKLIVPVIVGGNAVESYTFGSYATGDIDLVCQDTESVGKLLSSWGFKKTGRHWFSKDFDIAIEIPSSNLDVEERKNVAKVQIEGLDIYIIGIEDLIVDRLNSYVWWKYVRDGEWATELMAIHRKKINWEYLRKRCKEEGTLNALNKLRRTGRKK